MLNSQPKDDSTERNLWDELREEIQHELQQAQEELSEINLMLEQSQGEVNKLAQRHGTVSTQLQQVQQQIEALPRADIRAAYDAALESQQRLFLMRGQLDKLQSDRSHLEHYKSLLERINRGIELGQPQLSRPKGSTDADQLVEMMIEAQETERQRLARQMHDEPAQALSNFILQTEIVLRLFDLDQAKAREELTSLKTAAMDTFQKVRGFIFDLRPMMLDDLGLNPTLNRYIESYKERPGLDVRLVVSGLEQRLEAYQEVMIFRAVQELVGNAARHSQASQINVVIEGLENEVRVTVEDNGKGFEVGRALERGVGLKLIRDRVELMNGNMEINSETDRGTRVTFFIPATKTKVFA